MTYVPLKKDIIFAPHVKANPSYPQAMGVIKCLADQNFKAWLLGHIASESNGVLQDTLSTLAVTVRTLIGREAVMSSDLIDSSQAVFRPEPDLDAITLLTGMLGFLLKVQTVERAIIEIEANIEQGKAVPIEHLTRDGKAPSYIPRSRQQAKRYGRR